MGCPSPLLWMCETLHRLIFRLLSLQKPMARGILSPTQTLCPTAQSLLSWRSASLASSSRMLSRRKASQFWTTPRSAWKLAAVVIVTLCSCSDYHTSCIVTVVRCLTSVVIHHYLRLQVACHKRCFMSGGNGVSIGGHHVTVVRLCSAGSEAAGYQHHPLPRYHYWYGYHPDPERYCQAPKEVKPCFRLVHEWAVIFFAWFCSISCTTDCNVTTVSVGKSSSGNDQSDTVRGISVRDFIRSTLM